MTATDIHPLTDASEKSLYRVRSGHSLPLGQRVFPEGAEVLAEDRWVRAKASHILEPQKEVETVDDSSGQGRSKGVRVSKSK